MSSSSALGPTALQKNIQYILACKHQRLALEIFCKTPKWQIKKRDRRYALWQSKAAKAHQLEVMYILFDEEKPTLQVQA